MPGPTDRTDKPQGTSEKPSASEPALLAEYQAAQDSAQHHDNLAWSITSVMWGGSLVLMGFILQAINDRSLRVALSVLCVLGIALAVGVWLFATRVASVKRDKYERCQKIEKLLGLEQHSKLRYPKGFGRTVYGFLMSLFLVAWVAILWTVWCRCAG